jgi:hypothetical protein
MWRNTPSAADLRDTFPDVAMFLDTDLIKIQLEKLGIQNLRRNRKRSVSIEIPMHPHHLMRITPVDKGAEGYSEWMTWYWQTSDDEERRELACSIRAHVEIIDVDSQDPKSEVSFTLHNDDIESLIKNAIVGMRHTSGVQLKPVITRRRAA